MKKETLYNSTKNIYNEMITRIEDVWPNEHNNELVSTYSAQVGDLYPENDFSGILIYGRSSNGWDRTCPNGIEDHRTVYDMRNMEIQSKRRMYYRFIKGVVGNFYPIDEWYNYIAISNITKIVFCDKGNPSEELWDKQYDYLKPILEKEIQILSPKVVVFIIGSNIRSGYESPIYDLYPCIKDKSALIDKQIWGKYDSKNGEKYLTTTTYEIGKRLFIFTDRPDSKQGKPYINNHINTLVNVIKYNSEM